MTSFLEDVMRDSYRLAKKVGAVGRERKGIDEEMAELRVDLLKARRFSLDDEFVRVATEVSCYTGVPDVLQRLQGSLLPYERTWMEYNPRVEVSTYRTVLKEFDKGERPPIEETVPRMGLLLRRGDDSHQWTVTMFMPTKIMTKDGKSEVHHGEMSAVSPVSFLFDARGRDFKERSRMGRVWTFREAAYSCPQVHKALAERPETDEMVLEMEDIFKSELWGFFDKREGPLAKTVLPKVLASHAAAGVTPFFRRMLLQFDKTRRVSDLTTWLDQYRRELKEQTGRMRWLINVLCMLNEVPVTVTRVGEVPPGTGRRRPPVLSNSQRHFDHSVVTLRLPRVKNVVRYVSRKMVGGIRKRRHSVEEHWRTYLSETVEETCPIDTGLPVPVRYHAWEVDHEGGYRLCGRCGSYGRLIHEHERGDITLGWVTREFKVTANLTKKETVDEEAER